uniref:YfcE family phosphodiesterase n=1 Tax=Candidatus Methanomethylicus mesodigestus TaxID=1867258 RepID=A0A7C3J1L1_9CREN
MVKRILAISDIHAKVSSLKEILASALPLSLDAITISGDISHFGDASEVERVLAEVEGAGVPFFYVLGNCDPPESRRGVRSAGKCVEASCSSIDDLAVAGAGGSTPTPFSTLFEVSEDELVSSVASAIPSCSRDSRGALMLLVHNPPYGQVVDRTRIGWHVGSKKLGRLISEASPLVAQCGHIHEAAGTEVIGSTLVVNPGPAFKGSYAIIEIGEGKADARLGRV